MTTVDLDTSKSLCKSTFDHWRKAGKTDTNTHNVGNEMKLAWKRKSTP